MGLGDRLAGPSQIDQIAAAYFESSLKKMKLTVPQIEEQSLDQLEASLATVNDAIQNSGSFPVMKIELTAKSGGVVAVLADSTSRAHIEVGILPILLERKSLILERISLLRPAEQIKDFRHEVSSKVTDPQTREYLLKVLDEHAVMQQQQSELIEKERAEANAGLAAASSDLTKTAAYGQILEKIATLEKVTEKLDSEKVTKFDVVTIAMTILAAIGGLTGAVIAIIKWVTG
ncbi:hypothetical protein OOK27_40685 [Streptomyces canus]|uniref:hypothetical protein n=1 Tax=Streptomyces canus TaxID=58343 RepID=UPI0022572567|nr:hypothetical protein [Streptomyces canus]MCX5260394.1 hypothetical protein [Streptomyces canus]